jgi:RNA polymerase sigma-70 factor, ECF subfamily
MIQSRDTDTDRVLVKRAAAGDEAAFEELYNVYKNAVLCVVRRRSDLDENECNDVVQEIFFTVWEEITANRFKECGPFRNWLLRIARNGAINARRKAWVRGKRFPGTLQRYTADESYNVDAVGREPPPDHSLVEHEQRQLWHERLRKGLAQLPPVDAKIVFLYHMQELTYAEIGVVIGLSISQVWKRHQRAMARLRELCSPADMVDAF